MSARGSYPLKTLGRANTAEAFQFSAAVNGGIPNVITDPAGLVKSIAYSAVGIYTIVLADFVFAYQAFFCRLQDSDTGGALHEDIANPGFTPATNTLVLHTVNAGVATDISASAANINVLVFMSEV